MRCTLANDGRMVELEDVVVAANALLPLSSKGDDEQGMERRRRAHVVDRGPHGGVRRGRSAVLRRAGGSTGGQAPARAARRPGRAPQRTARQRADRSAPADRTTTRPGHRTGVAPQWHPSGSADAAGWAGMAHVHGKEVQSGTSYAVTCRTRTNLDVGRTGVPVSGSACGGRRRRLRLVLCAGGRSPYGTGAQRRVQTGRSLRMVVRVRASEEIPAQMPNALA